MKSTNELIQSLPLFDGLEERHLKEIYRIAETKEYQKGEMIFTEGDTCDGFYIVEMGQVKVFKLSFMGKEQILHIYGPGKPFGEVPVFTGKKFPASAQTITAARLIFFPREQFVGLIAANPSLSLNMLAVLSKRLREFTVMVENLALKEVPARLASYLVVLKNEEKVGQTVTLPVSKTQLAGLLGTTPETISRILTKMSNDGLIDVDRKAIKILDKEGLADLSEGAVTL